MNTKHIDDRFPNKRTLTDDDKIFLCNLQKEMCTQDNLATADPQYFVIMKKLPITIYGASKAKYCKTQQLRANDVIVAEGNNLEEFAKSIYDWITNAYPEESEETFEELKNVKYFYQIDSLLQQYDDDLGFDYGRTYEITGIEYVAEKTSQIFLTSEAAWKHLEKFRYHYGDDAYVYCDTPGTTECNEELTKLFDILHNVDFSKL